ncbi:MAG TPA: Zn-dependent alcohol dehydrogenase [Ktedonobacteraceae bacterium]|nr:Zn-dependent alcohol dehydrogenase [Ktedonobacteraceae bacterium]
MKAAVSYEPKTPLRIEELEIDAPRQGEVKIRLAATAVCHSDLHYLQGDWIGNFPMVAGHESAGYVEEVGENVTLTKPGDRVIVSLLRACGRCYYCTNGMPNHCIGTFALDTESRLRDKQGNPVVQGVRVGGFADYAIVDQSQVVQVSEDIPLDRAALLACGVMTGVGAVVNTAQVKVGSSVVVIGSGGVGLNAIQGAQIAGAARIIALDVVDMKLEAAKRFGATDAINAQREDLRTVIKDLTEGRGADYVFVTVGSTSAVQQGLTLLRRAGTLVIVGMPQARATAALPVIVVANSGLRILGSLMGSSRFSVDIPWLVDLYKQKRLKLDELITNRYPLAQINEAIESMEQGKALRNVIVWE